MIALDRIRWPGVVLLVALIAAVTLTALFGPQMGLRGLELRAVMGAEGVIGMIAKALLPSLIKSATPAEGARERFRAAMRADEPPSSGEEEP